ncbi:unnamed protein product [Trichogramma brassicae]|uniref:Uncharacterized protein n=1 Tax=Trichogramma brassicae TaxID=86971 RepID=A0A6H5I889_9HYME|nr:unnamed protein product [Trichogramma brassicae]
MFNRARHRAAFNTSSSFLDLSLLYCCAGRVPHPTAAIAAAATATAAEVAHNQGGAARLYEVSQMPLYNRPRAHEYYPWTEISASSNDRPPLSLSAARHWLHSGIFNVTPGQFIKSVPGTCWTRARLFDVGPRARDKQSKRVYGGMCTVRASEREGVKHRVQFYVENLKTADDARFDTLYSLKLVLLRAMSTRQTPLPFLLILSSRAAAAAPAAPTLRSTVYISILHPGHAIHSCAGAGKGARVGGRVCPSRRRRSVSGKKCETSLISCVYALRSVAKSRGCGVGAAWSACRASGEGSRPAGIKDASPFARREPYYTRAPEFTSPNRILPRPTYPRREEYHRDFRRDNTRNYQSNRPANVHEIDIHETEEEFPRDDVSAESNQQGSGNE